MTNENQENGTNGKTTAPLPHPAIIEFNGATDWVSAIRHPLWKENKERFEVVAKGPGMELTNDEWVQWWSDNYGLDRNKLSQTALRDICHGPAFTVVMVDKDGNPYSNEVIHSNIQELMNDYRPGVRPVSAKKAELDAAKKQAAEEKARADSAEAEMAKLRAELEAAKAQLG